LWRTPTQLVIISGSSYQYYYLLLFIISTSAKEVMFYQRLFVCLLAELRKITITYHYLKLLNLFPQNSVERLHMICGRNHYILVLIRITLN